MSDIAEALSKLNNNNNPTKYNSYSRFLGVISARQKELLFQKNYWKTN